MGIQKSTAFGTQAVEMRRGDPRLGIEDLYIAVTHVVGQDNDDVGLLSVQSGNTNRRHNDYRKYDKI